MKILRPHQQEAIQAMDQAVKGIIHLPTATGKTVIQSRATKKSAVNFKTPVYVVLSHRILLANQLFKEIRSDFHQNEKDCQYLVVNSGRIEDQQDLEWSKDLPYREVHSTTSSKQIKKEYERAQQEQVPLIVSGTYHSAERIAQAKIPIEIVHCDEAHSLVNEQFSWIATDEFPAKRKYFYTATLRETQSNDSIGMNNNLIFGEVFYQKNPAEMIKAGEMVRPRMHILEHNDTKQRDELGVNVHALIEGFIQHRSLIKVGAKMLVATKGSEELNGIINHPEMVAFREGRPNLTVFDISSEYHPRINGEIVSRSEFLTRLQSLDDRDEAIILHIRILTEGIDVPGITGVMIMNNQSLSVFLQTLGRATRLHPIDREKIYSGELDPEDLKRFIKPYAYVIVPGYGFFGAEIRDNIKEMIRALRTFDFNPSEDVLIQQSRGKIEPQSLEELNDKDSRAKTYKTELVDIFHEVESEEEAFELKVEKFRLKEAAKNFTLKLKNIASIREKINQVVKNSKFNF